MRNGTTVQFYFPIRVIVLQKSQIAVTGVADGDVQVTRTEGIDVQGSAIEACGGADGGVFAEKKPGLPKDEAEYGGVAEERFSGVYCDGVGFFCGVADLFCIGAKQDEVPGIYSVDKMSLIEGGEFLWMDAFGFGADELLTIGLAGHAQAGVGQDDPAGEDEVGCDGEGCFCF